MWLLYMPEQTSEGRRGKHSAGGSADATLQWVSNLDGSRRERIYCHFFGLESINQVGRWLSFILYESRDSSSSIKPADPTHTVRNWIVQCNPGCPRI